MDADPLQRFLAAQDGGGTYERALAELRAGRTILGGIDAVKLRSSMTLFAAVAPEQPVFRQVLERYFDGEADESTERWL